MGKSALGGLLLAFMGIVVGLLFEGGKVADLISPTAALIVFGGTLGAVMVQYPLAVLVQAGKRAAGLFTKRDESSELLVRDLVRYAQEARRGGLLSLDAELDKIDDSFLKKALTFAVDGVQPTDLRSMMEWELDLEAEREDLVPQVFEAAGGFSPTIGVLGAVIGLTRVMQMLGNTDDVGKGIAAAFVSTIYGIGAANLIFLPLAGRLKIRARRSLFLHEMALDAVVSIQAGMGPRALETRLTGLLAVPPDHLGKRVALR